MKFNRTQKILWAIAIVLAVASAAVWHINFTERSRDNLTVAFLDIGQGDAIFVESATGQQMLIDGGPDARVLNELGKVMPWYDKSIDMIVITNPDKDHIGGFINVLKRYKVSYILEPGTTNVSETYKTLEDLIKEKRVEKVIAKRGMDIFLGSSTTFHVLFPDKDVSKEKTNDGSIVGRLTYGSTSVMFTGDAPKSVENHLVEVDGEELKSDVLKVGHHGSKTATGENFVKMVKPQFAVISSGKNNKYGHPNQEVLDVLKNFLVKTYRTDEKGTVVMQSDGSKILFIDKL